ncbi:MAG: prolyl-tRNA synthetase associated domain-containing protein [Hyphomicrobium sp.]
MGETAGKTQSPARAATRQDLFERLAGLCIETHTVEHEPLYTVADSTMVHAQLDGAHTKNLFLKDAKGALFLVVAEVSTSVDLKTLPKVIGSARLSFGNADLLLETLGVTPGSVTAFAVINDRDGRVSLILDHHLMSADRINAHPLENTATTNIARDDLLRFIRSTGREPRVAVLDGRPCP